SASAPPGTPAPRTPPPRASAPTGASGYVAPPGPSGAGTAGAVATAAATASVLGERARAAAASLSRTLQPWGEHLRRLGRRTVEVAVFASGVLLAILLAGLVLGGLR